MDGINFENFSVKWVGFLRIPKTGKYKFHGKSDDGFKFSINGQTILESSMVEGKSYLEEGGMNIDSSTIVTPSMADDNE